MGLGRSLSLCGSVNLPPRRRRNGAGRLSKPGQSQKRVDSRKKTFGACRFSSALPKSAPRGAKGPHIADRAPRGGGSARPEGPPAPRKSAHFDPYLGPDSRPDLFPLPHSGNFADSSKESARPKPMIWRKCDAVNFKPNRNHLVGATAYQFSHIAGSGRELSLRESVKLPMAHSRNLSKGGK